jgi:hypothetical protein
MRFPILRPFKFFRELRNHNLIYIQHSTFVCVGKKKGNVDFSYYKIRVVFFEFKIFLKTDPNPNVRKGLFTSPSADYIYAPSLFTFLKNLEQYLISIRFFFYFLNLIQTYVGFVHFTFLFTISSGSCGFISYFGSIFVWSYYIII